MSHSVTYTLAELASKLDAELVGDASVAISGLGTLESASAGQLSFYSNTAYAAQLAACAASAVILSPQHRDSFSGNRLLSTNPYLSFAQASALFDSRRKARAEIHPSAVIAKDVELGQDVSIGPCAVVESGTRIGAGSSVGAHCYIGADVSIGTDCDLHPRVTLYHEVKLGDRVRVHSAAVIGADGFGFARDGERSVKIHQLGSVLVGDDVEIGAATTIDRGAIDDTIIGAGVKIDNQVQVGHNCVIGENSILCGCVSLAGSVKVGKNCVFGGRAGSVGHIEIVDGVQVSAMSLVSQSITEPGMYSSGTGHMKTKDWKRSIVRFQQLDDIAKKLHKLERRMAALDNDNTK